MSYVKGILTGLSLAACTVMLVSNSQSSKATFDSIDVGRINIREPDGTLRMVISNRSAFPGMIHKGKERPHPGRTHAAGMLFFNDEGTESGGLIYSGKKTSDGVEGGASLTFDRYEQDQVMQILQTEGGPYSMSGLIFSDRPDAPMNFEAVGGIYAAKTDEEREAAARAANIGGAPRMFVGRSRDRNSVIMLQDGNGVPRLMFSVTPEGKASIQFMDQYGRTGKTITPD